MGFLNFLKPKKAQNAAQAAQDIPYAQPSSDLSNEPELYSELPNLPEAPESAGMPDIDLPPPMKGFEDFSLPEAPQGMGQQDENAPRGPAPLLPNWPDTSKPEENELPELQETQSDEEPTKDAGPSWFSFEQEQATKAAIQEPQEERGKLISINNNFFMKANDFRRMRDNFDYILRQQKKHHRLTDIKKEENTEYDKMNAIVEDVQRKLMQIDKTLFEESS